MLWTASGSINWNRQPTYSVGTYRITSSDPAPVVQVDSPKKILGLDLDGTLITTKSGKKMPTSPLDWKWLFALNIIKRKLEEAEKNGHKLMVYTNQLHTPSVKATLIEHRHRIENKILAIARVLNLPITFVASYERDIYRKPCTGIIRVEFGEVDSKTSMFVGDAAGRPGDHSAADFQFALNAGWHFMVPEAFFLGRQNNLPALLYNPRSDRAEFPYVDDFCEAELKKIGFPKADQKVMIILQGCAGVGKSYLAAKLAKKYDLDVVCQDELKSKSKCVIAIKQSRARHGLILDRQNNQLEQRKEYIEIWRQINPKTEVIRILFGYPKEAALHHNAYRKIVDPKKAVPVLVVHTYYSKYDLSAEFLDHDIHIEESKIRYGPFSSEKEAQLFQSFI